VPGRVRGWMPRPRASARTSSARALVEVSDKLALEGGLVTSSGLQAARSRRKPAPERGVLKRRGVMKDMGHLGVTPVVAFRLY
jgi:hypothetical protein